TGDGGTVPQPAGPDVVPGARRTQGRAGADRPPQRHAGRDLERLLAGDGTAQVRRSTDPARAVRGPTSRPGIRRVAEPVRAQPPRPAARVRGAGTRRWLTR